MKNNTPIPAAIKFMIILVVVDVIAMMLFNYLDAMSDPDIDFYSFENLTAFLFPLVYLGGMIWFIRIHAPMTKIILYVVLAVEITAFIAIDFGLHGLDSLSVLSMISISAILGCIYIAHSSVGKNWFTVIKGD